jgi:uncharacterized protein
MFASTALAALLLCQAPARPPVRPDVDLVESAKLGQLARARESIARGASVEVTDRSGFTPLLWAAAGGQTEMVRLLLDAGAAADRRASDGTSALMAAAANGFTEVIRAQVRC